ncbi:hypothetical protein ACLOJK_032257 [Asimina triloba]
MLPLPFRRSAIVIGPMHKDPGGSTFQQRTQLVGDHSNPFREDYEYPTAGAKWKTKIKASSRPAAEAEQWGLAIGIILMKQLDKNIIARMNFFITIIEITAEILKNLGMV